MFTRSRAAAVEEHERDAKRLMKKDPSLFSVHTTQLDRPLDVGHIKGLENAPEAHYIQALRIAAAMKAPIIHTTLAPDWQTVGIYVIMFQLFMLFVLDSIKKNSTLSLDYFQTPQWWLYFTTSLTVSISVAQLLAYIARKLLNVAWQIIQVLLIIAVVLFGLYKANDKIASAVDVGVEVVHNTGSWLMFQTPLIIHMSTSASQVVTGTIDIDGMVAQAMQAQPQQPIIIQSPQATTQSTSTLDTMFSDIDMFSTSTSSK